MNTILLWVAVAFAGGIVLGEASGLPLLLTLTGGSFCLLSGLVAARRGRLRWGLGFTLFGFLAAGAAAWSLFPFRFSSDHVSHLVKSGVLPDEEAVTLKGWVSTLPMGDPRSVRIDLELLEIDHEGRHWPVKGKVRLRAFAGWTRENSAAAQTLNLDYGDVIRARVRLRRPRNFANPGSFDYRGRLENINDIFLTGIFERGEEVEKIAEGEGSRWVRYAMGTRLELLKSIDHLFPPWKREGRWGAMLRALVLGDRSALEPETLEAFRRSGLYHLLVISGLHLGLLALIGHGTVKVLRVPEPWRIPLVILFLLLYCLLIDLRASTLRALLMISLYLVGRLLARPRFLLNAIGASAFVLLLARPAWIFEAGFQLSFAAVLLIAGLVLPLLENTTEPYRRGLFRLEDVELDGRLPPRVAQWRLDLRSLAEWLGEKLRPVKMSKRAARGLLLLPLHAFFWAANTMVFTAILQIGLLLPMVESFHRVSLVGIGLNAVAVPLVTAILALGLPCSVLGVLWPGAAEPVAAILAGLLSLLSGLTELRLPPWLAYRVASPPLWIAVGFALSWVTATVLIRRRNWFPVGAGVAALFSFLIAASPSKANLPQGGLEMTALDVGYGDAIFLLLPDGSTCLVDAGGAARRRGYGSTPRFDPGEEVVSRYLWERGVGRVDLLILSTLSEHHQGGLAAVMKNFPVGELWVPGGLGNEFSRRLLALARERDIPIRSPLAGEDFERGGATFSVLWPDAAPAGNSRRADSLVFKIKWRKTEFLLAGDIRKADEEEILARLEVDQLVADVLKIPSHGFGTASSLKFLEAVRPEVAVISAGGPNRNRRPSAETLDRLEKIGAEVFRTDQDGAVTVFSDGNALRVTSFRSRPLRSAK